MQFSCISDMTALVDGLQFAAHMDYDIVLCRQRGRRAQGSLAWT